ncbi:hypothetical protein [Lignipirellula cremea]|uniref:Uncharacterized protein n=1 Tax=Lignipirellula cremea TaxID=2528010 RepID=A0A518DL24_9BACT|nr:hypothetical protein [Lignipirellula cremea]QDU92531.1 hypothetical protein Pla8534_02790 [Lignipirellula cremea]
MFWIVLAFSVITDGSQPITRYPLPANEATYMALALAEEEIQLAMEEANLSDSNFTLLRRRRRVQSLQQSLAGQTPSIHRKLVRSAIASATAQVETDLAATMEGFASKHPQVQLQLRRLERLRALANHYK